MDKDEVKRVTRIIIKHQGRCAKYSVYPEVIECSLEGCPLKRLCVSCRKSLTNALTLEWAKLLRKNKYDVESLLFELLL